MHLAAQPGVRGSFGQEFDQYVHDNILATQRLFDAARETGCRRVVYASSSSVYGDASSFPCFEDTTPTRPQSPYGVTKRTCEKLADVYRGLGVRGRRDAVLHRVRPAPAARTWPSAGCARPPPAARRSGSTATGRSRATSRYVADAVDAVVRAMQAERPGDVLNIGGGHEASMLEVIDLLGDLAGAPLAIERVGEQTGDVRRTGGDTGRARRTPRLVTAGASCAEGLAAELAWVAARRDLAGVATGSYDDREL